jgi:hypothetical protein
VEVLARTLPLAEREKRAPEVEADVDGQLGRLPDLGETAEGPERLLQVGNGLAIGRPRHGPKPRLAEIANRLLQQLALEGMMGQPFDVLSQVVGVHRFDRLRDPPVEEHPPRREKLAVHHRADPVVREVETRTDALEHTPPDQLFDSHRGCFLRQPTRAPQESELELTADDGCDGGELTPALAEPLQPVRNEITHTL